MKKFLGVVFCFSGCGFVNACGGVGRVLGRQERLGLVSLGGVNAHMVGANVVSVGGSVPLAVCRVPLPPLGEGWWVVDVR